MARVARASTSAITVAVRQPALSLVVVLVLVVTVGRLEHPIVDDLRGMLRRRRTWLTFSSSISTFIDLLDLSQTTVIVVVVVIATRHRAAAAPAQKPRPAARHSRDAFSPKRLLRIRNPAAAVARVFSVRLVQLQSAPLFSVRGDRRSAEARRFRIQVGIAGIGLGIGRCLQYKALMCSVFVLLVNSMRLRLHLGLRLRIDLGRVQQVPVEARVELRLPSTWTCCCRRTARGAGRGAGSGTGLLSRLAVRRRAEDARICRHTHSRYFFYFTILTTCN